MNKHQLKQSLHELSPTTEQKQAMLRNIRRAQPDTSQQRFRWLWRVSSAIVGLVIVIGLWQLLPQLRSAQDVQAPEAMAEKIVEEEASPMAAADEAAAQPDRFVLSDEEFDRELAQTPWQSDRTPESLPIFMPGLDEIAASEERYEEAEMESSGDLTLESNYTAAIVEYAVHRPMGEADHQLALSVTDQVAIISFEEAKQRLSDQVGGLGPTDITAGYLSYTRPEEASLIHPIYRFRYQIDGQETIGYVDARQ